MKKFALGVHHVNVAYNAGNEMSYHRQIREGIVPLLDLLSRHPQWCFTIEMSGFSIEFIAAKYPSVLQRMRDFIHKKQIELISSTYSPQIWIAFPASDLIKSIEINQALLEKYELPVSRVFFSQENFFGEGIKRLTKWFDAAVVKDDYYFYLHDMPADGQVPPYYLLDAVKVIVGWNHILQVAEFNSARHDRKNLLRQQDYQVFNTRQQRFPYMFNAAYKSQHKHVEWTWYHIGSSERFGKPYMRPENISLCRFNPEWYFFLETSLMQYEEQGYNFTGIGEFLKEFSDADFSPEQCPPLIDGSWNMERSKGAFMWMGYNHASHEDDLTVRNHNWRSRARLIGVESLLTHEKNIPDQIQEEVNQAWKSQLLAEASDSTGWSPDRNEVLFSIQQSENVLNTVGKIMNAIKLRKGGLFIVDTKNNELLSRPKDELANSRDIPAAEFLIADIHLFGATGEMHFFSISDNIQRVFCHFTPESGLCGIGMSMTTQLLVYSPALMDDEAVCHRLDSFHPGQLYLPLPNGLICVSPDVYIIKHNEYVNIACCIDRQAMKLSFKIENPHKRMHYWVFTVFKGKLNDAVTLAESINVLPVVVI